MNVRFAPTKHPRWMLVDDDREVLRAMSALIENLAVAEIECHDSAQSALAAFAAAPRRYELVITDLDMPGMDGGALCRIMQSIAPGQKVILVTGGNYYDEAAARAAGFCALLNKPFPLAVLHETLAATGLATRAIDGV